MKNHASITNLKSICGQLVCVLTVISSSLLSSLCLAKEPVLTSIKFASLSPIQTTTMNQVNEEETQLISFTRALPLGNLEFSLGYQDNAQDENSIVPHKGFASFEQSGVMPQISLFSSKNKSNQTQKTGLSDVSKSRRSDRYKNTIPAVYRITLKGYSVMEMSYQNTQVWKLDKMKNRAFRKPEIMFSVTKRF